MATRTLKDIPQLIELLKKEKARETDFLAKQEDMGMSWSAVPGDAPMVKAKGKTWGLMEQAHRQVAEKAGIPQGYYFRMMKEEPRLLTENVNTWWKHEGGKRRLVRCVDDQFRAFLSDRYRPISHLDVVTTAVQVVTGQGAAGSAKWAEGARCFSWAMSPMKLDVEFVNPRIAVDLNALDKGFRVSDEESIDGHGWVRPQGQGPRRGMYGPPKDGEPLWVFPSCRLRNSETGHGGLTVDAGIYEAICDNTCHLGVSMNQVHLGKELEESDLWSQDTLKKINVVVFAKVQDIFRQVFDPAKLLVMARRFKGLEDIEVDAREAADQVVKLNGLTEDIRDEILAAYHAMTAGRPNLFDFQRGVTGAAHAVRAEQPEVAGQLEDIGGRIIMEGMKVLVKA